MEHADLNGNEHVSGVDTLRRGALPRAPAFVDLSRTLEFNLLIFRADVEVRPYG